MTLGIGNSRLERASGSESLFSLRSDRLSGVWKPQKQIGFLFERIAI
jgi:hypothetical protein